MSCVTQELFYEDDESLAKMVQNDSVVAISDSVKIKGEKEMNNLQVFTNEDFGEVRTIVIDDEPWFVGKDVAVALQYSNPQKAIRDHVDSEDRTVNESFTVHGTPIVLINESGLYSLIMSSKQESAKAFKRWITHEVVPSIRKQHRKELKV